MACLTFSCTIIQKKKKELPYVHSLFKRDSTIYFQCACKKGKVAYPTHQKGEKNIKDDCCEVKTLYLIFLGVGELRVWLPLLPFVSAREIKNSKRKTRRIFFLIMSFFPLPFCDYDVGKVVILWKTPLQKSALSAKFQSFDRWLMKAELWLKELTDEFYFQKGWNRFMEITL